MPRVTDCPSDRLEDRGIASTLPAAGVLASDLRWPDQLVATVIAARNINAAIYVVRLAHAEIRTSRVECDPDSTFSAKIEVG